MATVKAMSCAGYSQAVIARHIGVSEPTLRSHYRALLDNATETMCALVFANLCKTATTKNDHAGVQAARYILSCRANWREAHTVAIESNDDRGIGAVLRIIRQAPSEEVFEETTSTHAATACH